MNRLAVTAVSRRTIACTLLVLGGAFCARVLPAAELEATGLSIPFHDNTGRLTHKLIAKRGVLAGATQRLLDLEIVYFAAENPDEIVQRIAADEATWDQKKQTLEGRGRITVATEENRLSGEGFDFAFATSRLNIQRNFTLENRELVVKSDRAVVELQIEKSGEDYKVRDVKRCEAIGHLEITVQPTATKDYLFEKAFSEIAIYDGATQVITLPKPIRYLRQGAESRSNEAIIRLKK